MTYLTSNMPSPAEHMLALAVQNSGLDKSKHVTDSHAAHLSGKPVQCLA